LQFIGAVRRFAKSFITGVVFVWGLSTRAVGLVAAVGSGFLPDWADAIASRLTPTVGFAVFANVVPGSKPVGVSLLAIWVSTMLGFIHHPSGHSVCPADRFLPCAATPNIVCNP
jgi:hypothetical protein